MSLLLSLFLGLIQGITEFLPVSSSGHLAILENIFKLKYDEGSNLFFDVMLHLGTLIAVIVFYRKELKIMVSETMYFLTGKSNGGRDENGRKMSKLRLTLLVVIGTLPLLLILPVKGYVEKLYGNMTFVAFAIIVTGVLLYISDRTKPGRKNERSASVLDALIVGCAQAIAVIPGLSRSGTTITAGMMTGFKRSFAVNFSFLLSIPAVFGSFIVELFGAIKAGVDWSLVPIYLAGMAVACVTGYLAIGVVRILVNKSKFGKLSYYCWIVGGVALIISFFI